MSHHQALPKPPLRVLQHVDGVVVIRVVDDDDLTRETAQRIKDAIEECPDSARLVSRRNHHADKRCRRIVVVQRTITLVMLKPRRWRGIQVQASTFSENAVCKGAPPPGAT